MAEVQLALQRGPAGFEKLVVVKLVHDNLATQKSFVDMLLDEARVAALVKHPNVVDIYDLGQADGRFFIAMEYLEGEPLLGVLRAGREGKRLDPLSTGRLIADTAEGLDAAHELRSMSGERLELVHHDISLGNIVVLYNGQVKLVDFGVAKASTAAGAKGKVQGKFSYMAPEKLKGAQGDRRSDIFSLGCVMWEALTLKRLFRGGNDGETMKQVLESTIQPPSKVNPDVPHEFDPIVMKALERDVEKRHTNAKDMAVEIEEVLRKRGYGAKNDKIAKYMQETFKGHIDARKKLVQEVVAKGSASSEVVEAAFAGPEIASGSGSPLTPVPGSDFSAKYRKSVTPATGVPAVAAPWADSSRPTEISPPPIMEGPDGPKRAGLPPPARASTPGAKPPLPKPAAPPVDAKSGRPSTATDVDAEPIPETVVPSASGKTTIDVPPVSEDAEPKITGDLAVPDVADADEPLVAPSGGLVASILADKKKRLFVFGGAALLLLVIIIVVASGGDDKRAPTPAEGSGQVANNLGSDGSDGSDVVPDNGTDDGSGSSGSATSDGSGSAGSGSAEPSGSGTIVIDEPDTVGSGSGSGSASSGRKDPKDLKDPKDPKQGSADPKHVVVPPPAINVEETVTKALQSFVKGDAKGALALLQKAKAAKPGYAPTYRVLGRVYKKLGDNANAKKAFQKYLQLAPGASDAPQIKDELSKL